MHYYLLLRRYLSMTRYRPLSSWAYIVLYLWLLVGIGSMLWEELRRW